MYKQIFFKKILSLIFILFTIFYLNSYSQTPNLLKVNLTLIAESDVPSGLDKEVVAAFREALQEKGMLAEGDSGFDIEILLDAKTYGDKIVIAVTTFIAAPPEVVSLGKEAEIFYTTLREKHRPNVTNEGKLIREYMSAEYIKQFRIIDDNSLDVIDRDGLKEYSRRIVSKL